MYAPLVVALSMPCVMVTAALLLASGRDRIEETSSRIRFKREVRRNLEPQIRMRGSRSYERNIAVLPRFSAMHLRGGFD
jgi:hypothetical protein